MTTYFEMRKGLKNEKRREFFKGLKARAVTGKSGKEFWKWVVGFEGRYKVSNKGRVKSIKRVCPSVGNKNRVNRTVPEKILKPLDSKGYFFVNLYTGSKDSIKRISIASLVLTAFVCVRPPNHEACHKDDDPSNNRLDNLYWGTSKQNKADAKRNGKLIKARGEDHGNSKLTEKNIHRIRCMYNSGMCTNYSELARIFGVQTNCIKRVVLKETWKHIY